MSLFRIPRFLLQAPFLFLLVAAKGAAYPLSADGLNVRQLQYFDLDKFQFTFAGIHMDAEVAQMNCPGEWQRVVSCMISDCPQFLDVCPRFSDPPSEVSATSRQGGDEEDPTCQEVEQDICDGVASEDCCLEDCVEHLQALTICVELENNGVDLSNCEIRDCSSTVATNTTPEFDCYTSLDDVYSDISDDDKLFQQKTYIICPGTVLNIGYLVPGVGIDQGESPIVPRANTEYLCGEDGKSENNCTIKGGDFGVVAVPAFFREDIAINNVQIKGFTFEGQVQYEAFVAQAGDISFVDCIFRDSANFGPLIFSYDSQLDLSRRLEVADEFDNPWDYALDYVDKYRNGNLPTRRLEEEVVMADHGLRKGTHRLQSKVKVFKGTIKDCLFLNLQQVQRKLGVEFGIISIKGPDNIIDIEGTLFQQNQYGNQALTPIGYAVLARGAQLKMWNNCFVENDFRGNGVVLLEQTENPFEVDSDLFLGNYVTEDDDLDCGFAAWFETDEDRRNSNFVCIDVQTDECYATSDSISTLMVLDEAGEETQVFNLTALQPKWFTASLVGEAGILTCKVTPSEDNGDADLYVGVVMNPSMQIDSCSSAVAGTSVEECSLFVSEATTLNVLIQGTAEEIDLSCYVENAP